MNGARKRKDALFRAIESVDFAIENSASFGSGVFVLKGKSVLFYNILAR